MPSKMLTADDVTEEVKKVLMRVPTGKGTERPFLTSYQVFDRLPKTLREQLVADRGRGGKGGGARYPGPRLVSKALESMAAKKEVEIRYLDTKGVTVWTGGEAITPGNRLCALFRLT